MQLKYCQKLDFEADPINKFKTLIIKNSCLFDFKIRSISLKNIIKTLPKIGFRSGPNNKLKALISKTQNFRTDPNNKHPGVN